MTVKDNFSKEEVEDINQKIKLSGDDANKIHNNIQPPRTVTLITMLRTKELKI
jgi:hypothetical protein